MTRILFLTSDLPFPPRSGGRIKSWKLLSYLCQHYDVGLATPLKQDDDRHLAELRSRAPLVELHAERVESSRSVASLVRSYQHGKTLNEYRTYSPQLAATIEACADSYDAIFVDHYDAFQYVPEGYRGTTLLHEHNAEYVIWERFASLQRNPVMRLAARLESARIRAREREICHRADQVFAAPADIARLADLGIQRSRFTPTYHLGDTALLERPTLDFDETEASLLYFGTLSWEANADGLLWFLRHCWPLVKKRYVTATFHIAGSSPSAKLERAVDAAPDVALLGFVDDLEPWFRRSRVFVCPILFGSGMKVKLLEAMYRGIPSVVTTTSIESISVRPMVDVAVADEPAHFAELVGTLLSDRTTWERLRDNSRALARARYQWGPILESTRAEIESCLQARRAA